MGQKSKQDQCVGTNIRAQRLKMGWTQEQTVAKLQLLGVDMARDYYAHIENGSYNIRTSELTALQQLFRCSYDDFFANLNAKNDG